MAWTAPKTYVIGELATAAMLNLHVRDNLSELRAGGLAGSGQASGAFMWASGPGQLAFTPAGTNTVPRWNGTTMEMVHPLALAYPIGCVLKLVVSTNPNTLLGFGTWELFGAGRTQVALDSGDPDFDTVEETTGEKTVTLTIATMPSHTHLQDAHTHDVSPIGTVRSVSQVDEDFSVLDNAGTLTAANKTAVNQNAGGGGAHNNLMPYFVGYCWKRVA